MNNRNFFDLLHAKWNEGKFLCVGLDPVADRLPQHLRSDDRITNDSVFAFLKAIIEQTADLVCAFKPNSAFYEALGVPGMDVLAKVCAFIRETAPDVAIIMDAKRGDIQDTNIAHAAAMFDVFKADAVTVQPYLGGAALRPYLERKDKGVFVLCRTSNNGAGEFQDCVVDGVPLYQLVAKKAATEWNGNGNCALVMGATYPKELAEVRAMGIDLPFLIPGVGAQGGGLEATVAAGRDRRGQGIMINASRSIIFASGGQDFAQGARAEAQRMHEAIQKALK